jgi:hypothetical protein
MSPLSQQMRNYLLDSACAMQLHTEAMFKILKNGGSTQQKEIEISLRLMQKCLTDMQQRFDGTQPTEIVNSQP